MCSSTSPRSLASSRLVPNMALRLLMLAPVMAIFTYFRIYPIVQTFVMSLYKWDFTAKVHPFIGLANYQALPHDERFMSAIRNTTDEWPREKKKPTPTGRLRSCRSLRVVLSMAEM